MDYFAPWTTHPIGYSLREQLAPWTSCPRGQLAHRQFAHRYSPYGPSSPVDYLPHGQFAPWTILSHGILSHEPPVLYVRTSAPTLEVCGLFYLLLRYITQRIGLCMVCMVGLEVTKVNIVVYPTAITYMDSHLDTIRFFF
jgi:hypothetical protein